MAPPKVSEKRLEAPVTPVKKLAPSWGARGLILIGVLLIVGASISAWKLHGAWGHRSKALLGILPVGIALIAIGLFIHPRAAAAVSLPPPKPPRPVTEESLEPAEPVKPIVFPKAGENGCTLAMERGARIKAAEVNRFPDHQSTALCHYSFIGSHAPGGVKALRGMIDGLGWRAKAALGIMYGNACGDAIGAPFEFLPFKKKGYVKPDFTMTPIGFRGAKQTCSQFDLKPGQWTDDNSMGLCLADVLIHGQGKLDQQQLSIAFHDWWFHGYNNAFTGKPRTSIGLGGNISEAIKDCRNFKGNEEATGSFATRRGNKFTSGNGGIMRLGAVVPAARSLQEAEQLAWDQSLVTHQGEEAAACAAFMAHIMYRFFSSRKHVGSIEKKKALFDKITSQYKSSIPSVTGLARSQADVENPATHKSENWNWRSDDFTFHEERAKKLPGYIGSYAMDGLAMALHCIHTTDNFRDAVIKAATRGGDADSVGAIVGQIAGAIYGFDEIPSEWVNAVQQWDRGGEIGVRAILLLKRD